MSQFVEFLPGAEEPVTLAEAKANARVEADVTWDDDFFSSVLIPGARQLAETRTGACLKSARWKQRLREFPKLGRPISITHSLCAAIESLTYLPAGTTSSRSTLILDTDFEAVQTENETHVAPLATTWPSAGQSLRAVEIIYTAGLSRTDMTARYPSIRQWILMAVAWGYDNRTLFIADGTGFTALPDSYHFQLLDPIAVRPRF